MHAVGGFGLEFVDKQFSLFARDDPKFPTLGMLLARPACWADELSVELAGEELQAVWMLPQDSPLFPFLRLVMEYTRAMDKTVFLEGLAQVGDWTDSSMRFAGYRALDQGLDTMAIDLFGSVLEREQKDYLAAAFAMLREGDLDKAEKTLHVSSQTSWQRLEYVEVAIMYSLLRRLEEQRPLTLFEDGFVEQVSKKLEDLGIDAHVRAVDVGLFCTPKDWEKLY
jgi:hypothetical protein